MPKPERHVLMCLNQRPAGHPKGCCGEKGAEALFGRLKALVAERGMNDRVMVTRTGCLKHCSRGVTLAVYPENVWYGGVSQSDAEEILEHLTGGGCVERLLMPDVPWE